MISRITSFISILMPAILLSACASNPPPQDIGKSVSDVSTRMSESDKPQEQQTASDRLSLYRDREVLTNRLIELASAARTENRLDDAEAYYKQALQIDADNSRAKVGLTAVTASRSHQLLITQAQNLFLNGDIDGARERIKPVLLENPNNKDATALQQKINENLNKSTLDKKLGATYKQPISLEFRDASLKSIFELMSRITGINFVLDKEIRLDTKVTIFFKNSAIEDALHLLLTTNQLEQEILNDNTVLIYPTSPQKLKDYQDLVIKSFFLANADPKQMVNMIRAMTKTADIYVDEKLNLLVMRDTPEAIAIAERLIATSDLAEPEVMLEIEVLEVSTNKLSELGMRYPDQVSLSVKGKSGGSGTLAMTEIDNFSRDLLQVAIPDPALVLNLRKTDTNANILASPRIRVKNREKARIHIGERVPVITTTTTANVGVSDSVNYLDVGLKLDVEPNVFLENEVGIKVGLEVSNILDTITTSSGTQTYRLGTRTAATALRLKDGETQILAGLIQDQDRKSANKIPLLGDIPILGRLFSNHNDSKTKTEIVLLVTPHIIRNIERPDASVIEFYSGTGSSIGSKPLSLPPSGGPVSQSTMPIMPNP
ncbi:MAG: secretin and TonB N-terminal domain-containing protein [Gammaproteobacteria bacterium]|nr:secretin and TonB N-terminal domain-containing protein [Gammaproteobacteria bacterium]